MAGRTPRPDAHAGRFKVLVVWALDRLSRRRIAEVAVHRRQAGPLPGWRSSTCRRELGRHLWPGALSAVAVMSWCAQQERARLVERTLAGLARARAEGRVGGRPRFYGPLIDSALARVAAGDSTAARGEARRDPLQHPAPLSGTQKRVVGTARGSPVERRVSTLTARSQKRAFLVRAAAGQVRGRI